ncbi:unnamed protein product [Cuscuta europaea]|uniref:Uncharacterized protein n=1 Tax=Cuscuta europaea TaxID=41803 RepID=A0A9P1EBY4_CUSEU|nr:unnamed protein product [Cuscuta europaea]
MCSARPPKKEEEKALQPFSIAATRAQAKGVQRRRFEKGKVREKREELRNLTKGFLEFAGVSPEFVGVLPEFHRNSTEQRRTRLSSFKVEVKACHIHLCTGEENP